MPHWMLHVSDDDGSSHAPQLDLSFRTCTHRYSLERSGGSYSEVYKQMKILQMTCTPSAAVILEVHCSYSDIALEVES